MDEASGRVDLKFPDQFSASYAERVMKSYEERCTLMIKMIKDVYPPIIVRKMWRGRKFCYWV